MLPARITKSTPRRTKLGRPGDSRTHLVFVRKLGCVVCSAKAESHHLLKVDDLPKGMGRRNADRWAIPLCRTHHNGAHMHGDDEAFLAAHGVDGRALASALWSVSGDVVKGLSIVLKAQQRAKLNGGGG